MCIYTETEAAAKWCQPAQAGTDYFGSSGTAPATIVDGLLPCRGSLCMMWRWIDAADQGANRRGVCGHVQNLTIKEKIIPLGDIGLPADGRISSW